MSEQHFEHNPKDHEDPAAGSTYLIGFIGAVLLVVIVLGVTALYYNVKSEEITEKVENPERKDVRELRREQESLINGPMRVLRRTEQGVDIESVVIPIEDAMELTVDTYGSSSLSMNTENDQKP